MIPYPIMKYNKRRKPCFAAKHPVLSVLGILITLLVTLGLFIYGFTLILI